MKAYNGEIAARACFVRIGRDPDKDPELLAEIQRAIENGVNEARKFGTPAAVHDAQQKAVAAAEEVSRRLAQLLAFKDWDDVGIGVLKEDAEEEWKVLFNALAQLRAVKETE